MQWQKLKNVNVPIGVLLQLHNTKFDAARFAIRDTATTIRISSSYKRGRLTGQILTRNYQEWRSMFGNEYYYHLYQKPGE